MRHFEQFSNSVKESKSLKFFLPLLRLAAKVDPENRVAKIMAKQKRVVFILRTCRTLKHRCQINPTRNLWHVLKMSWINLLLSGKQGRVNSIKSRWSETIGKFHFFIGVKIRVYTTKFCFRNSVFGGSLFQDFQSFSTRNKFCYTKLWFRIEILVKLLESTPFTPHTLFENHRKSLIQHFEWTKVDFKSAKNGQ